MTEFRTKGKGKEKKVYPINRKAYGIPRELALKDVQQLRDQGKRARLIETNKRLDLYAPYISELQVNAPQEPPKTEPVQVTEEKQPMQGMVVQEKKAQPILESLGIINEKGNSNQTKGVFRDYISIGKEIINVEDGRLEFTAIDHMHVAMVRKRTSTTLPNGKYEIKESLNGPTIESADPYNAWKPMKLPDLNYNDPMSTNLHIEKDQLKDFLRAIDKAQKSGENVQFRATAKGSLDLMAKDEILRHYEGHIQEGLRANYSSEYLSSLLRLMLGNKQYRNPKGMDLVLSMKNDYPITLRCSDDSGVDPVGIIGLLAPRME